MTSLKTLPNWLKVSYLVFVLIILSSGMFFYKHQERELKKSTEDVLKLIAESKVNQIAQWRSDRLKEAVIFLQSPFFFERTVNWLKNNNKDDGDYIHQRSTLLKEYYNAYNVLLIDTQLQIRYSLVESSPILSEDEFECINKVIENNRETISDLHFGHDNGVIHLGAIVPILIDDKQETVGVFVIQTAATEYIYPLLEEFPIPSESGESIIVTRKNNEVVFLNELRHQKDTALTLKIPLTNKSVPAVQVVLGVEGIVYGKDYRNIDVIAAVKAIPDSDWFLIAKIDSSEALSLWRFRSALIILLIVMFILGASFITGLLWQKNEKMYFRNKYQNEQALRRLEERNRIVLLSVGDGVIVTDAEGSIDLMNETAEQLTGWTFSEAKGKNLTEVFNIINEKTRKHVENPVSLVLKKGKIVGLANHTILISKDGTERAITDSAAPVRCVDGEITGVVMVFSDQTADRMIKKALSESEAKLKEASIIAKMGRWDLYHQENKRLEWSDTVYDIFEVSPDSFNVTYETFSSMVHPDDRERIDKLWNESIEQKSSYQVEHRILMNDGRIKWVLELGKTCCDDSGKPLLSTGVVQDITELKHTQEALAQSQKMETIGKLAGGVAHDYNNMLMIILGYVEISMAQTSPESTLHNNLMEIYKAAQRSSNITKQLLAFARKQTVKLKRLNINDTITDIYAMLRNLIVEEIDLIWKPADNLWHIEIDPAQIDQILVNLVVNAQEAIPGVGSIIIETDNADISSDYCDTHHDFIPGKFVRLSVSDSGTGMPKDVIEKIFLPFFSTKEPGNNSGLGLSTVFGIVKQNDGFINVYSEPDNGTTFKIYLPAVEAQKQDEETKPVIGMLNGSETILLVDDEMGILEVVKPLMENYGYQVITAELPSLAIDIAKKIDKKIDLLITDVIMPEINGYELKEKLREIHPDIKCLFMSGYTNNVIAHRNVLKEGIQFIQKPFLTKALMVKVREILNNE